MRLLEQYNEALRRTEDVSITQLNRILDASFNRLIRRTRVQIRTPLPAVDRNLSLLQEFRESPRLPPRPRRRLRPCST